MLNIFLQQGQPYALNGTLSMANRVNFMHALHAETRKIVLSSSGATRSKPRRPKQNGTKPSRKAGLPNLTRMNTEGIACCLLWMMVIIVCYDRILINYFFWNLDFIAKLLTFFRQILFQGERIEFWRILLMVNVLIFFKIKLVPLADEFCRKIRKLGSKIYNAEQVLNQKPLMNSLERPRFTTIDYLLYDYMGVYCCLFSGCHL